MDVRLKTKKEGLEGTSYEDVDEEEVTRVVRMSFGVCRALPVPILWGGGEMRKKGMRDYHDCQVVSLMDEDGQRFITPSRSWISTCREMEESEDRAVKHAYKGFLPSRERLVQMVMGERLTGNTQGILYPKTQSVVRLGRKNARIDEGYNEVALVNRQEIEDLFGGKVEVVDSVCQGEAFAVVINYSNEAIKLPAGTLSIVVRPAISLPTLLNAEQVRASGQNGKGENEPEGDWEENHGPKVGPECEVVKAHPRSFYSWNMNGLGVRVRKEELGLFYQHILKKSPDVISLLELHLTQAEEDPTTPKEGACRKAWETFFGPMARDYDAYLSLNSEKKGGTAVLVKKGLADRHISYEMGGGSGHEEGGRFIKLAFPKMNVVAAYVPFNGKGQEGHLERRRRWDKRMRKELLRMGNTKARIVLGDMNVALESQDMSEGPGFWLNQTSGDPPIGDKGFGGTTANERSRAWKLLDDCEMEDSWARLDKKGPRRQRFTWLGVDNSRFANKGLRLDYVWVDKSLARSGGIQDSRVLNENENGPRSSFMGSDHMPIWCELNSQWFDHREGSLRPDTKCLFTKQEVEGSPTWGSRPDAFPEELWSLVHPDQRNLVEERFKSFKSEGYLHECIRKVREVLDIGDVLGFTRTSWSRSAAAESKYFRAQALANLDSYFSRPG